jgi:hypothetical protein
MPFMADWAASATPSPPHRANTAPTARASPLPRREEPVVGEQGGPLAGLVLAVLLGNGHREGQPAVPLLVVVDGLEQVPEAFHRCTCTHAIP